MKRGIVPGTFDPVTSGHLDIIERAAPLFDELIVGVALSPQKNGGPLFSIEERVALLEAATSHLPNLTVRPFDTLLVDFAESEGASVIIKGLRAVTDFEREFQMAALNWRLSRRSPATDFRRLSRHRTVLRSPNRISASGARGRCSATGSTVCRTCASQA